MRLVSNLSKASGKLWPSEQASIRQEMKMGVRKMFFEKRDEIAEVVAKQRGLSARYAGTLVAGGMSRINSSLMARKCFVSS